MRDKETNKRNEQGAAHGLWINCWSNNNKAIESNYINGRLFGYHAYYGVREELVTARYYAR
jgi:hypothetical protein